MVNGLFHSIVKESRINFVDGIDKGDGAVA